VTALEGDRDGTTYDPSLDRERLNRQARLVYDQLERYARIGQWLTLGELQTITRQPQASISARLRDLRKPRFGGLTIERRRRLHAGPGVWEYLMRPELPRATEAEAVQRLTPVPHDRAELLERLAATTAALRLIGTKCSRYTRGRCSDNPGLSKDARYGADRWCHECIAAEALEVQA
jgi:hypothetical protein